LRATARNNSKSPFFLIQIEETAVKAKLVIGVMVLMIALVQSGTAGEKGKIQKYFSDTACQVKATTDPVQKREILVKSLQSMSSALERVEKLGLIAQDDRGGIDRFKNNLQEKQDELKGANGYERVADAQLNAFSDYVVQDMEQAAETITISLVAALLIIIIVALLV